MVNANGAFCFNQGDLVAQLMVEKERQDPLKGGDIIAKARKGEAI